MLDPSPLELSTIFSSLIGRNVAFKAATPSADLGERLMFAIYNILPQEVCLIVKADLCLLASFAGALIGLPDVAVREHLELSELDELLRDAIHEVLNIASAVVTNEGKAVFQRMVVDQNSIGGAGESVLTNPSHRICFNVSVEGYEGGRFSILMPHMPAHA